jgi:hypothetical protein
MNVGCFMNNVIAFALLIGGLVLLLFGFNASQSFQSDVSRFFTGSPTDKAIWMIVLGAAAMIAGLVGLLRRSRA